MHIIEPICSGYVPFCSMGRVKIQFISDPVDGVISQFTDIESEWKNTYFVAKINLIARNVIALKNFHFLGDTSILLREHLWSLEQRLGTNYLGL